MLGDAFGVSGARAGRFGSWAADDDEGVGIGSDHSQPILLHLVVGRLHDEVKKRLTGG